MIIKKNEKLDFFSYTCTSIFRKKEKIHLYKAYSGTQVKADEPLDFNLMDEMLSVTPEGAALYLLKTLSSEDRTNFAGSEVIVLHFTLPMDEIRKFPSWDTEIMKGEEPKEWMGTIRFQMRERQWTKLKISRYRIGESLSFDDKGDVIENIENLELEKID